MKKRDFGNGTNVFLLDTSQLDLNTNKGLKGKEYNELPSIGELEAWFIFECPIVIEKHGLDAVIDSACEAFNIERDIMEPLILLIIAGIKNNPEPRSLFKSLSGKKVVK